MSTFPAGARPDEDDDPDDLNEDTTAPAVRSEVPNEALCGKVVAVIAYKGGVGKTTLAYELAYLLRGVLVDFEYDKGAATVAWGYRYQDRTGAPLIEAIEKKRIPAPLKGVRKPDLVPGHPDLATAAFPAELVADSLEEWAREWQRPVIVDSHPGGSQHTLGAAAAATVIVSPVVMAMKELEALDGMTDEMADYPLLIVPNKVTRSPNASMLARLQRIGKKPGVRVGPLVSQYAWLPSRTGRVALTSYDQPSKRIEPIDGELRAVAREVTRYAADAQ